MSTGRGQEAQPGSTTLAQVGVRFLEVCGDDEEHRRLVEEIEAALDRQFAPRPGEDDWPAAVLGASELLGALILEREWEPGQLEHALEPVVRAAQIEPDQLVSLVFVAAARNLSLSAAPSPRAIEAEVRLLRLCAPVCGAALVKWSAPDQTEAIVAVGLDGSAAEVQAAATRALLGADPADDPAQGALRAIAVGGADQLGAARPEGGWLSVVLVVEPLAGCSSRAIAFATETAAALGRLLRREAAVDAVAEAALGQAHLLRNRLHDGPLQSLALLSGEVQLLRSQFAAAADVADGVRLLAGRLDDILAQVLFVQRELRALTQAPPLSDSAHSGPGNSGPGNSDAERP